MKPLTESVNRQAILRARATIEAAGGRIDYNYTIVYGGDNKEVLEAIIYLVNRWDYEFRVDYRPTVVGIFWGAPVLELIFVCGAAILIVCLLCILIF